MSVSGGLGRRVLVQQAVQGALDEPGVGPFGGRGPQPGDRLTQALSVLGGLGVSGQVSLDVAAQGEGQGVVYGQVNEFREFLVSHGSSFRSASRRARRARPCRDFVAAGVRPRTVAASIAVRPCKSHRVSTSR